MPVSKYCICVCLSLPYFGWFLSFYSELIQLIPKWSQHIMKAHSYTHTHTHTWWTVYHPISLCANLLAIQDIICGIQWLGCQIYNIQFLVCCVWICVLAGLIHENNRRQWLLPFMPHFPFQCLHWIIWHLEVLYPCWINSWNGLELKELYFHLNYSLHFVACFNVSEFWKLKGWMLKEAFSSHSDPEANWCPLSECKFMSTQKELEECNLLIAPRHLFNVQHSIIILPSCTAWKGLFPSTNSTEMVIFSVSRISLFKLRSATARRNTSSSFRADSSKMAPVYKEGSKKEKETITQYYCRGLL